VDYPALIVENPIFFQLPKPNFLPSCFCYSYLKKSIKFLIKNFYSSETSVKSILSAISFFYLLFHFMQRKIGNSISWSVPSSWGGLAGHFLLKNPKKIFLLEKIIFNIVVGMRIPVLTNPSIY